MRKRSALRDRAELVFVRALFGAIRRAPRGLAERLGFGCAKLLDKAAPRLRRTAMENLAFAYPGRDEAWRRKTVDGVFESIGRVVTSFACFPDIHSGNIAAWSREQGYENYERAMAKGKGVLFAGMHLGNWELCAFTHSARRSSSTIIMRPLDNPLFSDFVNRRRSLLGNVMVSKREFVRGMLHALHKNEPAAILMDQNSTADVGVFVPFFGRLACTNLAFAKLAARTGAAVIPVAAIWNAGERRYEQHYYPEVPISGDALEDTARVQAAIEAAIREYPDQWLWIHRRWKTRPAGE